MNEFEIRMSQLEKLRPARVITWTLLFLGGVVMVTPIIFMVSTSFKSGQEVYVLSIFPDAPTLKNYLFILEDSKFLKWMLNSLWVATFSTASVLFFEDECLIGIKLDPDFFSQSEGRCIRMP